MSEFIMLINHIIQQKISSSLIQILETIIGYIYKPSF